MVFDSKQSAYVFPGQGAQSVGMGKDLYDSFDSIKALFKQADEAVDFPLSKMCFEGPEDELRKTTNAQPALVTVSIACLKAAQEVTGNKLPAPTFMVGHSLGEYTALAADDVIDFSTAVYLARERGRLMYEAGLKQPGTMMAILGLDETVLAEICQQTGTKIANINCPGQLVISGAIENIAKAAELAKAKGAARVIPLQVSGAFHSPLMQSAVDGMAQILAKITFKDPTVPIIANVTAQPLTVGTQFRDELLNQLCSSVQWQRSIEYLLQQGVTRFTEIGPGKVLTGLIKRIDRDTETINISDATAVKNMGNG
ncbi:MAG: ACP S-malonyltransferase [Chloroflexi bacterium]|nr:ACP S-malonyltransferase [Chloroflexota bacterium]